MPAPYPYDTLLAADPSNPSMVATNADILLFEPGDPAKTPVVIWNLSRTIQLPNPVRTNSLGFAQAPLSDTLRQLAWEGGGLTGIFTSVQGIMDAADAAAGAAQASAGAAQQAAADAELAAANAAEGAGVALGAAVAEAEAAKVAAQAAAGLVGAPAGAAVLAAIQPGGAAHGELSAAIGAQVSSMAKRGIFENFLPENFRIIRAAIARQMAGGKPARVSVLGDSNSNGFMAADGSNYLRSYGERARHILDGEWGPSRTGIVYTRIAGGGAPNERADNRITLGTGWSMLADVQYGPATSGAVQGVGPTAGNFEFITPEAVNTYDVYLKTSASSPTEVNLWIDGDFVDSTIARDTFATDGALTTTEKGAAPWTVAGAGTWTKTGGKLQAVTTGQSYATANTGQADGIVSGRRGTTIFDGLVFRLTDTSNHWMVAQSGGSKYILAKRVGAAVITVATSTRTAAAGDLISVTLNGNNITVSVNGSIVPELVATDAHNSTATRHGFRVDGAFTNSFDDFSHTTLAPFGTTVNLSAPDGLSKVTVSAATVGIHTLKVRVISGGSAVVSAIEAYDASSEGLRWTLAGYNGGTASQWTQPQALPWGNMNLTYGVANPDLIVINLMINAHNGNYGVAGYKALMKTMIEQGKASGADVILVASAAGGNGSTVTWVDYLNAQRELAAELGCGLINMQERWGPYALSNAEPFDLWADADHPNNRGYWDMGLALADGIKLAVGRSA